MAMGILHLADAACWPVARSKLVLDFEADEIGVVGAALESPAGEESPDHKLRAETLERKVAQHEVQAMTEIPMPAVRLRIDVGIA